jgi:hypothetical protein
MDQGVCAAAGLAGSNRKDLAIQALARSETVSDLAARHWMSRKFVYQQAPICGRPLLGKGKLQDGRGTWSDAVICPAFIAPLGSNHTKRQIPLIY